MSRSSYSDDFGCDFPGQMELYRANVTRSIRSKDGQARLRELKTVLEALPQEELGASEFLPTHGPACALGAWADWATTGTPAHADMLAFHGDDHDTEHLLRRYHWPKLVVLDLVYINDESSSITAHERYRRVLAWVTEHLEVRA